MERARSADRRLRVAHVYAHLDVGGIERSLADVLPRLDPARYDVRMICSRRRGRLADDLEAVGIPVQVRRCPSRLPVSWSARRLAHALRAHRVDLVHAHAEHAAHCATEAARLAGVPLVVATFHTTPSDIQPESVPRLVADPIRASCVNDHQRRPTQDPAGDSNDTSRGRRSRRK